jgi:hypothetical protein
VSARLHRLEALLGRVTANAARPRTLAVAPAAQAAQPEFDSIAPPALGEDDLELDAPDAHVDLDATVELEVPVDLEPSRAAADDHLGLVDRDQFGLDAPESARVPAGGATAAGPAGELVFEDESAAEVETPALAPVTELEEVEDLDALEEVEDLSLEFADALGHSERPEDEPPPESHSAPVVSASVAQAIDDAALIEPPPLTPPPESGEEPAGVAVPAHGGPTMEQLGQTITLPEGPARDFELDEPVAALPEPEAQPSRFEAELPAGRRSEDELELPPDAAAELERVRLGERVDVRAEVIGRPVISTNVVELLSAQTRFRPETFGELLDASLAL